ncbi:MAG: DUF3591 domain-containing protein, partial [Terriglobus roseus]|nr:DUF3591 domain-containing protein [Terriglobus roseus]
QRRLFAESLVHREELPAPPEDADQLLQTLWPRFDPDEPARFQRLLPPRNAVYGLRKPLKPPKPISLAKLNLELRQDQEKTFRLTNSAATHRAYPDWTEREGLIAINTGKEASTEQDTQVVELDEINDDELVAGLSMQDLTVLCADWDIISSSSEATAAPDMMEITPEAEDSSAPTLASSRKRNSDDLDPMDTDVRKRLKPATDAMDITSEAEDSSVPTVTGSQKQDPIDFNLLNTSARRHLKTAHARFEGHMLENYDTFFSLDDPEATNAFLSRRVPLDLNDPHVLVDFQQPDAVTVKAKRPGVDFRKDVSGSLTKSMSRKYNISNDDAYELLKENHSSKIRSMIGNLTVEHSMPALKLQFPFYKVKLTPREARSYHRPALKVPHDVNRVLKFKKRESKKRKELKSRTIRQIFAEAKDLGINDNCDIAMCEYSEEQPMVLSDFGMGNKLINYYRRQDEQDNSRPKYDLGDTSVLLPQDKSPYSIFGNVSPGEHQPTIHNAMFRAPVWQHREKPTDFILGRSTTGVGGSEWWIRRTSNLFVAGQQLPSVEVPGTHSRKVTDAAKRRLKQISFRVYHKFQANPRKYPPLTNDVVREHLPGSDVPQNRGKMREFMEYDKANSMWVPKRGDIIPDNYAGIRERLDAHIRPEDVCLLDAMQVGHQYLKDAGIDKDDGAVDEGKERDDEEKDDDTLEEKLAPWNATKNFLKACQGQAMLTLHGPGDPTGRGEGFSFVKTSMKGGFKAVGESIEDRLDKQRLKEYGGHSYNVAKQQKAYEESIGRIWD